MNDNRVTSPAQKDGIDRRRYGRITRFFAGVIAHVAVYDLSLTRVPGVRKRVAASRPDRYRQMARDFRQLAIDMGGVMIKLGQFLSTRVDVLPIEIVEELRGLQDEVPPVDLDEINAVMRTELGDLDAIFSTIEPQPLAAASLGQTHRAWLHPADQADDEQDEQPGAAVVIKVQRPNIEQTVRTDLAALRKVAKWVMRYRPISSRADIPAMLEEFADVLWEELDYRMEVENAARFRDIFTDYEGVYTPQFYTDHCTENVLVMENVEGLKLTDLAGIEAAGIDAGQVADRLLDVYFMQVLQASFFHADPHPGNLFIQPRPDRKRERETEIEIEKEEDEEIEMEVETAVVDDSMPFDLIFIDFGMMGRIPDGMQGELQKVLISVVTKDARGFIESFDRLGFFLPSADLNRLADAQSEILDQVWGRDLMELNNPDPAEARMMMQNFKDILYDFPFQVPQNFIYLGRAMGILSGMSAMLNPDINPWYYIETYGQRVLQEQQNDPDQLGKIVREYALLPGRAKRVLDDLERGRLRLQFAPDKVMDRRLTKLEKRTRQTNTTILSAAGLVSGTLLYMGDDPQVGIGVWVASGLAYLWSLIRRRP